MKIKNKLVALALSGALLATPSKSQIDISLSSKYLAGRAGFEVVGHPVVQSYGGINSDIGNFYAWSNIRSQEKDVSELDLGWTSPSLTKKNLGGNLAITGYTYPNKKDWQKWDVEYGVNLFSRNLSFDLNLYGGINQANDKTSRVYQLSLGEKINNAFSISGSVAYSDNYYSNFAGFSHLALKGDFSKPILGFNTYFLVKAQKKLNSFGGKIKDNFAGAVGVRF